MKKKQVAILVASIVVAIIIVVVILFNIKTYDIMYNTNGGSFVPTERVKVFKQATRPVDPTKDGFTFDNWYYNDGIFDFDTKITEDMVIEARWIEGSPVAGTYIVSFNSNGGSSVASVRTNTDGTVNQPADPVREGYKFVSWQYKGEDFDFSSKVTTNITLIAKWEDGQGNTITSVPAEKVTLSPTTLSLRVGNTRRLAITLTPVEAVGRTYKWTTSNSYIATVDNNGTVRARGVGTAIITLEVDGKKASVTVTVTAAPTTPVDPNPVDPNPVDPIPDTPVPEQPETYTIEYVPEPSSAMGEVYVRIKGSKRGYVSGTVQITTTGGQVINEPVTSTGKLMPRSVIQNAIVISAN